jgi:predicted negative regulator of RcsB-dependent stress response
MSTVDDDQIEQLRRLWDRYGRLLVAALVVILAGVAGRTVYDRYQDRQAVAAAALYASFQKAAADQAGGQSGGATNAPATDTLADQLRTQYPRSSYATFASLTQAKQAVEAGKPDVAEQRLRWVIDASPEPADRALARLRLARLLLDQGKTAPAAEALQKDVSVTAPAALELRGDIAHAEGKAQDARQAYQEALAGLPPDSGQAAVIKLKLDALGQP